MSVAPVEISLERIADALDRLAAAQALPIAKQHLRVAKRDYKHSPTPTNAAARDAAQAVVERLGRAALS